MISNRRHTIQRVWFNGREFQRITWAADRVTITWAITSHVRPGVFRATFMGRREI